MAQAPTLTGRAFAGGPANSSADQTMGAGTDAATLKKDIEAALKTVDDPAVLAKALAMLEGVDYNAASFAESVSDRSLCRTFAEEHRGHGADANALYRAYQEEKKRNPKLTAAQFLGFAKGKRA